VLPLQVTQGDILAVGSVSRLWEWKPAPPSLPKVQHSNSRGRGRLRRLEGGTEVPTGLINGEGGPVDKDDPWALPDLSLMTAQVNLSCH
jgi:hypothetical protein